MDNKTAIEMVTTQTTIGLEVSSNRRRLNGLSLDEILLILDQINERHPLPPSVIDQWFSAGNRDYARVIEESKIKAIEARKNLIEGLGGHIRVYVIAYKDELKVRAIGMVTETFDRMVLHLAHVNEIVIAGFYDVYLEFVDNIMSKTNLSDEIRKIALVNALVRLNTRSEQSQRSILGITESLRNEIIKFNSEIGMC
ncbi:MAG: hypothetical protein ACD_58C00297G0002 [uncultured bacterium]|nr:MAG: hypothetical protein ACD_58C00297G0002 [uncultured bacterium]